MKDKVHHGVLVTGINTKKDGCTTGYKKEVAEVL